MRHVPLIALVLVTLAAPLSIVANAARAPEPTAMEAPGRPLAERLDRAVFSTMAVETTLASFTFENGSGGKDAQGWTTVDRTAQLGAFFHVDDFAGLGGPPWVAISGTKSLWCGARPCASPSMNDLCSYATLPGYGNGWDQRFTSTSFSVTGDVTITFDARYDVEATYDNVYLEYSASPSLWQPLATFTGTGAGPVWQTVAAGDHSGSIRFRFRVVTDNAWSDEDGLYPTNGALVVDNLIITDDNGVVDSQDFESEPTGFPFTMDSDWFASTRGQYGSYAALLDGATVLQEDPSINNTTYLWGFFSGSTANYGCGGFPGQAVVPFTKNIEGTPVGILNEIRSPEIPYLGVAPGSPVRLDFDVYTDMPMDNLMFYEFRVRSKVGGVWKRWRSNSIVYYKPEKEWFDHSTAITTLVEAGATSIQVAIGARDMCATWCGVYGTGACHSHGPLIDNVRVIVSHDAFAVTNTNDSGAGSLREAITQLNTSIDGGVIRFDIPGIAPFVISLASPLPAIVKSVVIDGTSQPGYNGTPLVRIAGTPTSPALTLSAANSRLLALHITGSVVPPLYAGIVITASNNVVQRCIISDCGAGIAISGSSNLVGGTGVGDGNTIYNIESSGVVVYPSSAERNRILGNSIYATDGPAIDLTPGGVNPNDPLDADFGANGLQNHPVITAVTLGSFETTIDGTLGAAANTVYRIEFFTSDACSPAINGFGQTYYGFSYIMTDGSGQANFSEYFANSVPTGSYISATATDPYGNTSEISPCLLTINTPVGSGVVTGPIDETTGSAMVAVTFDQVTGAGNTSLVTGPTGPALPGTFDIGDGVYYDISTTATFTGNVEVCISYNEGALTVPEADLRLLHWDDPIWVDITTSLDTFTNQICGQTDHFSPFVLAAQTATGIGDSPLPQAFALRQNIPNPFNPTTTIAYDVPAGGADVTIRIYDVAGREVRTLVDGRQSAGAHQVTWDGRNASGSPVSTGVYFYRMVAGSFVEARRMVLLK